MTYTVPFEPGDIPRLAVHYDASRLTPAAPIVVDSFREAGATLISHVADTGQNWTLVGPGTATLGDGLEMSGGADGQQSTLAYVDAGIHDQDVTCDLDAYMGVVLRYTDTRHYILVTYQSVYAFTSTGGISWSMRPSTGSTYRVVAVDDRLEIYNQGVLQQIIFDLPTLEGTGVGVGVLSGHDQQRVHDFVVRVPQYGDGDRVSYVRDLSGHGRHLLQHDWNRRPRLVTSSLGINLMPKRDRAEGRYEIGNWNVSRDVTIAGIQAVADHLIVQGTDQCYARWGSDYEDLSVPNDIYTVRLKAMFVGQASSGAQYWNWAAYTGETPQQGELPLPPEGDWTDFAFDVPVDGGYLDLEIGGGGLNQFHFKDISIRPKNAVTPNGKPHLWFDGADDTLATTGWYSSFDVGIHIVGQVRGRHSWERLLSREGGYQYPRLMWDVTVADWVTMHFGDGNTNTPGEWLPDGVWHAAQMTTDGILAWDYTDGVLPSQGARPLPAMPNLPGDEDLIVSWDGDTVPKATPMMSLAELAIWDHALVATDVAALHAAAHTKWGTP